MGASESHENLGVRETRELQELEVSGAAGDCQDISYPWFQIVQWACDPLPSNQIYKWNYDYIKQDVNALTAMINSKQDCTGDDFLHNCPSAAELQGFTMEDDNIYVEWAAVFLMRNPSLSRMRYRLVPSRVTEAHFWQRYFTAIRGIIQKQVLSTSEALSSEQSVDPLPNTTLLSLPPYLSYSTTTPTPEPSAAHVTTSLRTAPFTPSPPYPSTTRESSSPRGRMCNGEGLKHTSIGLPRSNVIYDGNILMDNSSLPSTPPLLLSENWRDTRIHKEFRSTNPNIPHRNMAPGGGVVVCAPSPLRPSVLGRSSK